MPSNPASGLPPTDRVQQAAPAAQPDSLASLLSLLASVYGMHPGECGVCGSVCGWVIVLEGASFRLPCLQVLCCPTLPHAPSLYCLSCTATCTADLFLEESLRYDSFGAFMEGVASSGTISASPSAFQAYLEVLTALAAGERGARSMYLQASISMAGWAACVGLMGLVAARLVW